MHDITTHVGTDAGDLRALVRYPDADGPLPGVVLIDGSGEGTADGWGQWPSTVAGCGAVVLSHDKPGCGGSPGDWRAQSFADRARESLAAVEVLRRQPGVDPDRVGLLGISQGAWITYLAAALAPEAVHQIVAVSVGVSVVEQERYRLELAVDGDDEAMAWVDERARRLLAGDDPAAILADQRGYADRTWYSRAIEAYGTPGELAFVARNLGFDAADSMRALRCPAFARRSECRGRQHLTARRPPARPRGLPRCRPQPPQARPRPHASAVGAAHPRFPADARRLAGRRVGASRPRCRLPRPVPSSAVSLACYQVVACPVWPRHR